MSWNKPEWDAHQKWDKDNTDKEINKDWRAGGNPFAHKSWKDGGDWRWGGKWSDKKFEKHKISKWKPKDWRKP